MKLLLLFSILILFQLKLSAQTDSIKYHDDIMESQWGSSTANDEFGCFVRFTPASYPARLVGVKGYFRNAGNNSTIRWKLYIDPNGSALGGQTVIYQSPFTWMNPAAGGIVDQQYDMYNDLTNDSIVITSGDVYVGVVQSNDFFGMGIDNAPDDSVAVDRQWQWMTVFGQNYWNTLSSQASGGQFGITAYFNANPTAVPETNSQQPKLFFVNEDLHFVSTINSDYSIEVYNLEGKCLIKNKFHSSEFILATNLLPGTYLVKISKSNETYYSKIVKS